ncbi:hypothetical protein KM043_007409 [Ampulex compressa]|nr:hypothetical protein KM043_007409 [Ampulex compressa]
MAGADINPVHDFLFRLSSLRKLHEIQIVRPRPTGAINEIKYLREVTPYFRKASIIQEVGWELQRGFLSATPPPPKSPPRADTRYLPLQLCRLTRAHHSSDPGGRQRREMAGKTVVFRLVSAWLTGSTRSVGSGSKEGEGGDPLSIEMRRPSLLTGDKESSAEGPREREDGPWIERDGNHGGSDGSSDAWRWERAGEGEEGAGGMEDARVKLVSGAKAGCRLVFRANP